jgi:DNA-binding response OmpR family regulator
VELLLLTADPAPSSVLPALTRLPHRVQTAAPELTALQVATPHHAVLVDARSNVVGARNLCRLLRSTRPDLPVIAVLGEAGLVTVSGEWMVDEIVLSDADPAEVDARLRLLRARPSADSARGGALVLDELVINEATYAARLRGRLLELTYKEFELLNYLVHHPGQVFSRAQLLQQVWGYECLGDVRTVDVHIRRLRAKLGAEHEQMIGTVHEVGYRFVPPSRGGPGMTVAPAQTDDANDHESNNEDDRVRDHLLGTVLIPHGTHDPPRTQ